MSSDRPSRRVLVIDSDLSQNRTLKAHFESEGYEVFTAASGQEGMTLAQSVHPTLILLDARLPDLDVQDAFQTLRDQPRTGHIPVMVMAGQEDSDLQKTLLEKGAYDFVNKPLDLDILTLLIRNALRRAEREGLAESRTGLPTGRLISERLAVVENEAGWNRIDLSIREFDSFRDLYGFVTANEALRFAGSSILQILSEQGSLKDFVGHYSNTEEFVILTTVERISDLGDHLTERLNSELQSFYNFVERDQGYVLVDDGTGKQVQKPLMSVQITITESPPVEQTHAEEEPEQESDPVPEKPATPHSDPWVDAEEDRDDSGETGDTAPDQAGSAFEW